MDQLELQYLLEGGYVRLNYDERDLIQHDDFVLNPSVHHVGELECDHVDLSEMKNF